MSNEGSFDHLGTFGKTDFIDNKSYSSKSWHDQIDTVLLKADYIFRESRVESWTPTAGYTAPSPSPPDGWASRWILYKYTFLILSSYPILCPGLRCCPPWCGSPGPWGQNRARVPQILSGEKTHLVFNFVQSPKVYWKKMLTDIVFWFFIQSTLVTWSTELLT